MRGQKMTEEEAFLKGAHKKDPQRYRTKTPKNTSDIGFPPQHLDDEVKAIWHEVVANSLPGTLTASERVHLEALCGLIHEMRTNFRGMQSAKLVAMVNLLAKLGMNPIDRRKLGVEPPKEKEEDPFKGFN